MSGTEENLQNKQLDTEKDGQSGTDKSESIEDLKAQIASLRKENAKYRISAKNSGSEKETISEELKKLRDEFEATKKENILVKRQSLLDKAGCVKSELVVKDIPEDCEDVEKFIDKYKEENPYLFKETNKSHGGNHKGSGKNTLTPSQQMDAYIRAALGR